MNGCVWLSLGLEDDWLCLEKMINALFDSVWLDLGLTQFGFVLNWFRGNNLTHFNTNP